MEEDKDNEIAKLQDNFAKSQLQISYLQKENKELRHTVEKATQQEESEKSKGPPRPTAQEKGKQGINVEEMEEPKVQPSKPMTRAVRPAARWKKKNERGFSGNRKTNV